MPIFEFHLDIIHPLSDAVLFAFDVHDAWGATVTDQNVDIVKRGGLLELGYFLPGGNVMCSNECIIQTLHGIALGLISGAFTRSSSSARNTDELVA